MQQKIISMKMKNQRFLMLLASILVFGSMAFAQVPKGNDKSKDEHILTWALPEELVIDNNSIVATYNSFLTPFCNRKFSFFIPLNLANLCLAYPQKFSMPFMWFLPFANSFLKCFTL